MHSIFQIRISRNTKYADKTGFPDLITYIATVEMLLHYFIHFMMYIHISYGVY